MASTSSYFYRDQQAVLDDVAYQFHLEQPTLEQLVRQFLVEFQDGLGQYGKAMAMIPTFVTGVPDGSETGTFLALDLGGTNLRVCEVHLKGDKTFTLRQQKYKVSDALKTGEASVLFDYLADSVDAFLTNQESDFSSTEAVHLGLTFSFPVEQSALDSGKILTWTKGFSARNAIGNDVVKLLQDAFDRKHMHVKCVALVNDTVGAMLSRAYTSGGCILGAIFGTGTNGAYVEQVSNLTKLGNSPAAAKGGLMVVNTEWGGFNNARSRMPSTPFDNALDRESINPGFQAFEKFISGMYLGEVTRRVLLSLVDAAPKSLLFKGKATKAIADQWGLDTSVMSAVEEAWEGEERQPDANTIPDWKAYGEKGDDVKDKQLKERLERVRDVIASKLGYDKSAVSLRDAHLVRWVASMVARRAALLSGVSVAAVLVQTGRGVLCEKPTEKPSIVEDVIKVGVDGSLVEHYPHFELTLRESLRMLVGEETEKKVEIGLAKDGSGVGAALCALQASKQL